MMRSLVFPLSIGLLVGITIGASIRTAQLVPQFEEERAKVTELRKANADLILEFEVKDASCLKRVTEISSEAHQCQLELKKAGIEIRRWK